MSSLASTVRLLKQPTSERMAAGDSYHRSHETLTMGLLTLDSYHETSTVRLPLAVIEENMFSGAPEVNQQDPYVWCCMVFTCTPPVRGSYQ